MPNIYSILSCVALVTRTNPATNVSRSSIYDIPNIMFNGFNFYGSLTYMYGCLKNLLNASR